MQQARGGLAESQGGSDQGGVYMICNPQIGENTVPGLVSGNGSGLFKFVKKDAKFSTYRFDETEPVT